MSFQKNKNGGFVKMIILLIILIATLSYFKINLVSVVKSEPVQSVWIFSKTLFKNYIAPAGEYVWNNVLKEFLYKNVVNFFTKANEQISHNNINNIINLATTSPKTN